ncbi:hypothetical protein PR202_ga20906 [Eleusine coracana subsp. coracana]|uniref:F-box domain-containing protein n=1 Tax=Eleusine coracana subsp. coracana TaxID=191504 RepID=A0AAV5CZH0_ELECO|nr:hypothetical protein QOZ80_8AG0629760 [Eleusine coracana subsp. coracana]GJN03456.1 hypothetical protein PR202_ga20906 [Eleusine coracana subsp. coracana]
MDSTLPTASGDPVDSEDTPMVHSSGDPHDTDNEASASAPPDLPDAAIYNILIRLPPSCVTRSKLTCKDWLSMISHRSFKRGHRATWSHLPPATGVLLFDGSARYPATVLDESGSPRLSLRRWGAEPKDGYTVQYCCGPLACLRTGHGNAQLLHPATGRSLVLGGGSRRGHPSTWTGADTLPWYCLGRCAATHRYKVVRLDVRLPFGRAPHMTCDVLTVGRDSWDAASGRFHARWEEVGPWDGKFFPTGRGVQVAGVVYYLSWFVPGVCVVISFDLHTHRSYPIRPPGTDADLVASPPMSLVELDGRLCVSQVGGGGAEMRVYALGDEAQPGAVREWTLMYRFELEGNARAQDAGEARGRLALLPRRR